jgi:hypothetical protein
VLKQIKAGNDQLVTLARQQNETNASRKESRHPYDQDLFNIIQRTAEQLFRSLSLSLACHCDEPHNGNPKLQHRSQIPVLAKAADKDEERISFILMLECES